MPTSREIQALLRDWVREALHTRFKAQNKPAIQPATAYPLLVYIASKPGEYDVQDTGSIERLFRSAQRNLAAELKQIDRSAMSRNVQERYLPYKSADIVCDVMRDPRTLYRMIQAEAKISFVLTTSGNSEKVRRRVRTELGRFPKCCALRERASELILGCS